MPGDGFRLPMPARLGALIRQHAGRHIVLGIRPEHMELDGGGGAPHLEAQLNVVEPLGSDMDLYLSTKHHDHVVARVSARAGLAAGARVRLGLSLDRAHLFEPGDTGANLTLPTTGA